MIEPKTVLKQITLGLEAASTMLAEDPALLAIQSARRLPPSITAPLARLADNINAPSFQSLSALLRRDLPLASSLLDGTARNAFDANVLALAGIDPGPVWKRAHARWLWNIGRGPEAVRFASGTIQQRLKGMGATQVRGFELPLDRLPQATFEPPEGAHRVLHVLTNSLPHTQSGYSLRTHHSLVAMQKHGVEVLGVTRLGYPLTIGKLISSEIDVIDSIPYQRLLGTSWPKTVPARLLEQARQLVAIANDWKPNILHTTTDYRNALVTSAVAQRTGIPWVYEMRGELESTWLSKVPERYRDEAHNSWHYRSLRARELEMATLADHVVALSHVQRNILIERDVPADKITVVPNAVPDERIGRQYSTAQARDLVGLETSLPVFGSISSVVDYEGFDTALYALRELLDEGKECLFVLVGDGVAFPNLQRLAEELDVSNYVRFVGKVSPETASIWYQALDCFIIPRKDIPVCRRVTPLKGIEAVAYGIPLVVSDLPAVSEVTPPEPHSRRIPATNHRAWASAIWNYLKSPNNRLEAADNKFAFEHSYSRNATRYNAVYDVIRGA